MQRTHRLRRSVLRPKAVDLTATEGLDDGRLEEKDSARRNDKRGFARVCRSAAGMRRRQLTAKVAGLLPMMPSNAACSTRSLGLKPSLRSSSVAVKILALARASADRPFSAQTATYADTTRSASSGPTKWLAPLVASKEAESPFSAVLAGPKGAADSRGG